MLNIIGLSPIMANASNMPHYLSPHPPHPGTEQEITRAQAIVGTLLYNARAVDHCALGHSGLTVVNSHNNNHQ
jgi:hypothetical protein